jgi:NAD(P)-dependent dehydrogenase (short-subunit alcohol dehydrogenase family)
VSGGSSGIGRATAGMLAAAGARVCLVARDGERLGAAVAELKDRGRPAIGIAGDAREAETRERSVRACIEELGGLDILVNTVGGAGPRRAIAEMDETTVRDLARLNVETALFFSQLAWRQWMGEHGGSIVNITSLVGKRPQAGYAWYGATKAALSFLTQVMALEFAPKVRVNAVAPGMTVTETTLAKVPPEYLSQAGEQLPLRRLGPSAAYTTGQEIAVEGGALLL